MLENHEAENLKSATCPIDTGLEEAQEHITIRCLSAVPMDLEALLAEIEQEEQAL